MDYLTLPFAEHTTRNQYVRENQTSKYHARVWLHDWFWPIHGHCRPLGRERKPVNILDA